MSVVATGAGHFQIPAAPAGGTSVVSGSANAFTGTAVQMSASTSAIYITGVHVETSAALAATYVCVQLMSGAGGAETAIGQYLVPLSTGSTVALGFHNIFPPLKVAASTRLSVKTADSVGSKTTLITAECILQSNVIDDGIAVGTVTTVTNQLTAAQIATGVWQDTTAGDFTTALSVGKSIMNGVSLGTGLTVNSLTNLPSIPANWLTAAGINASALNGKGDWNIGKTGYTVSTVSDKTGYTLSSAGITAIWQDTTAGDFTTAGSIGKSIMNGVALGTGLTVNDITTKTGYSLTQAFPTNFSAIGITAGGHISNVDAVGSVSGSVGSVTGLTASNLDTTVSSRSTYAGGAVASVTGAVGSVAGNVVGSVGSVTGLTASDVGAIKTKTDQLTFTKANELDANVQSINDTTVIGDGSSGSKWRA